MKKEDKKIILLGQRIEEVLNLMEDLEIERTELSVENKVFIIKHWMKK